MGRPWRDAETALGRLFEQTDAEARTLRHRAVAEPAEEPVGEPFLTAAARLPTPSILWDTGKLERTVRRLRGLLGRYGFGLGVALKACANRDVLALLSGWGLHADAMSLAEYQLARQVGFGRVSATGPSFRPPDMRVLLDDGVLFDAQSYNQLSQLVDLGRTKDLGIRFQVPRPATLRDGSEGRTRFGIPFDTGIHDWLAEFSQVVVSRIRLHINEGPPELAGLALRFRTRLALLQAAVLGAVREINLGGGVLTLARRPELFEACLADMASAVAASPLGPDLELWLEPGSAVLLDSAYLVTEVVDTFDGDGPAVVVDTSPWNVAPWACSSFTVLGEEPWRFTGDVYGATLYENDRFRRIGEPVDGRTPRIGDRLLVSCFGAYTLTQGRRFGRLPLPAEYAFAGGEAVRMADGVSS